MYRPGPRNSRIGPVPGDRQTVKFHPSQFSVLWGHHSAPTLSETKQKQFSTIKHDKHIKQLKEMITIM